MAANFDPEHLIILVEERHILYNKRLPEYSDRYKKEGQWEEVTQSISGDTWTVATSSERRKMCKDIQLKWKHLRDSFRKELQAQKTSTSGQGAKKKKNKYRYFDQLLFLTSYVSDGKSSGNYASSSHDGNKSQDDLLGNAAKNGSSPASIASRVTTLSRNSSMSTSTPRRNTNKQKTFEDEVLHVMKSRNNAEDDEDRAFCMSLVKSLKKMNDETKLNAKIDILHVIRNYTHTKPNYTQISQNPQQMQTANIHRNIQQSFAPYNLTKTPQNSQQIQNNYKNIQQSFTPYTPHTLIPINNPTQNSYTDPDKKITILNYETIPSGSIPQSTQRFFSNFAPNSPCTSTDTNE